MVWGGHNVPTVVPGPPRKSQIVPEAHLGIQGTRQRCVHGLREKPFQGPSEGPIRGPRRGPYRAQWKSPTMAQGRGPPRLNGGASYTELRGGLQESSDTPRSPVEPYGALRSPMAHGKSVQRSREGPTWWSDPDGYHIPRIFKENN